MIETFLSVLLAVGLDRRFKEVRRFHPLVGFGNYASSIERRLNASAPKGAKAKLSRKTLGVMAWCFAVLPFFYLAYIVDNALNSSGLWRVLVGAFVLYVAIGWQSLIDHAHAVSEPLQQGNLEDARTAVGMIVSRDTQALDETQVASAATESVLENGADAIFAALFWFIVAGIPGVVLYRLSNTLDAMWGYRNERFEVFGWMAARTDDLLNYVPARLTALSYAIVGNFHLAVAAWRVQGNSWKSPNAGPVMASGAGAIKVRLGGGAIYHGVWQDRDSLGPESGASASWHSVEASVALVNRTLILWLALFGIVLWVSG